MNEDFNSNTHIDKIIIKFLDGQITAEEENELRVWAAQSKENRQYIRETQHLLNTVIVQDKTPFDSEAAFQRFKARIAVQETLKRNSRHFNIYHLIRWFSIFLIAFLSGGMGFYIYNDYFILSNEKQYSISIPKGSKAKIRLPDKSIVWLNSASTLSYSRYFGIKNRHVFLRGEGYFEVTENSHKPFFVNTKHTSIKVLGTKFDVCAYPDDKHIQVTLIKDSIQLKTNYQANTIILKPNQMAVINKKNHHVNVIHISANKPVAWKKGIFFEKELSGGSLQ